MKKKGAETMNEGRLILPHDYENKLDYVSTEIAIKYVKDLFEAAGISDAGEKAVRFYSNMFFFYSVYDGAEDKNEAKRRFEHMAAEILKDIG